MILANAPGLCLSSRSVRGLSAEVACAQALSHEPGSHIVSSGALATLSGAKTGRTPKDKRVVRESGSEQNIWCDPAH